MSYEIIKKNFLRKLWTGSMVKKAVGTVITTEEFKSILSEGVTANVITSAQYQELTGEAYQQ